MKKKILVVDDEESIILLYRLELEDDGFEVVTASSGAEALEKVETEQPDLVTLDIKMPGMDGIETLHGIRERMKDRHVPVVLCTAYEEYKQDFTTWASDAYVVKSHDLAELKATIHRLLAEQVN